MEKYILSFIFLCLSISPSWANDSIEAAATGNIAFENAPEIIIQDETLTISKSKSKNLEEAGKSLNIDVDFHFKNTSDHTVTRKISFVLPPVVCSSSRVNNLWWGLEVQTATKNLKDFITTVDNQPVAVTIRKQAVLGKDNITTLLDKLHIPLNPCLIDENFSKRSTYMEILKKNHLLDKNNRPAWTEKVYYEWTQNFPAGQVTRIQHHYTPANGEEIVEGKSIKYLTNLLEGATPIWSSNPEKLKLVKPSIVSTEKFSPETIAMLKKNKYQAANIGQELFCVMPLWVKYHLISGAGWKDGIGHFTLIIKDEAGAPFAVNKFFGSTDDIKTSIVGDTMTFTGTNFMPKNDLTVLFLGIPKSNFDANGCVKMNE